MKIPSDIKAILIGVLVSGPLLYLIRFAFVIVHELAHN